jgi:hypothetical protein
VFGFVGRRFDARRADWYFFIFLRLPYLTIPSSMCFLSLVGLYCRRCSTSALRCSGGCRTVGRHTRESGIDLVEECRMSRAVAIRAFFPQLWGLTLLAAAGLALGGCSTGKAAQSDLSGMVKSLGMPALARTISPLPNGGINTYDPSTGSNM